MDIAVSNEELSVQGSIRNAGYQQPLTLQSLSLIASKRLPQNIDLMVNTTSLQGLTRSIG